MVQTTPCCVWVWQQGSENSCDSRDQQEQSMRPPAPPQRNVLMYGVESIAPSGPPHRHVFCGFSIPSGRHPTFGVESAFCSKYVNNIQALKTPPFLPLLYVLISMLIGICRCWNTLVYPKILTSQQHALKCMNTAVICRDWLIARKLPDKLPSLLNSGKHII